MHQLGVKDFWFMFYREIQLNYAVIICITGSHEHYNQKLVPCSADGISIHLDPAS